MTERVILFIPATSLLNPFFNTFILLFASFEFRHANTIERTTAIVEITGEAIVAQDSIHSQLIFFHVRHTRLPIICLNRLY